MEKGKRLAAAGLLAANRCIRDSFYITAIPKTSNDAEAIAGTFSGVRNASVPLGSPTPGQPNIASTLWQTLAVHRNRRYFVESARTRNVFWMNLAGINFSAGQPARRLTLTGDAIYAGDASAHFGRAEPYAFLAAEVR